ncbi:MAG: ADP-ribosylation factor-like protein [Promethearchaeota archaeon]
MTSEDGSNIRKIIFTGLDNAGKTSIIFSLLREISKIATIKPTRNAERRNFEFLGMTISEWDLGGQERFRKTYLEKAQMIFRGTDIMIYVVDVQDRERIVDSCSYLYDVVDKFTELGITPSIHVFFHKFDPELMVDTDTKMEDTYQFLKKKIESFKNYKNFSFYKTTIFNLPSIVNAMSKLLINLYPKGKVIDNSIKEFAQKCNIEGIELLDNNSLIIGSYYENDSIKKILNSLSPYFLRLNDGFERTEHKDQEDNYTQIERMGKFFIFKRFKLTKGASPYYLLFSKAESSFDPEEFNILISLLNEILSQEM